MRAWEIAGLTLTESPLTQKRDSPISALHPDEWRMTDEAWSMDSSGAGSAYRSRAGTRDVLYTNGPINGENDGYQISGLGSLTDSFSVSSISIITSAMIGIWERPADLPVQLQWSIGTSQFGSQVSSGTSTLSNVFFDSNNVGGNGGWDVYSSTFTLSGKVVPGTQYWLTLQNLIDSNSDPGYWDQNNGPSLAVFANNGTPLAGEQSNSFTLFGSPVPEPSGFVLLGTLGH